LVIDERQPVLGLVVARVAVCLEREVAAVQVPAAVRSSVESSSSATGARSAAAGRTWRTFAATARLMSRGTAVASSVTGLSEGCSPDGKSEAPRACAAW
jgi:hypothetical protein